MLRLIIFIIFSSWAVISSVYVILWLLSALISIAGIFFVAGAELVGAIQLLIYAVAVAVFYIFVLTAVPWEKALKKDSHYRVEGVIALPFVLLLYVEMLIVFTLSILFSKYFIAFEIVSLVLLMGMIGAVLIGRKESQTYDGDTS